MKDSLGLGDPREPSGERGAEATDSSRRAEVTRVAPHIWYVDTRPVDPFGVSGVYIILRDGITLVETGTSLTAPHVLRAIRGLGASEKDIRRVILTHIHLDHAGAAGWLVRRIPHVRVYVHERGAGHLADPSRLLESAETVYGSRESVLKLHGEIFPVPAENLVGLRDGEIPLAGGAPIRALDTPGHAPHHLCVLEPETGCLFSGEALGHYYPESDAFTPSVAPPSFDLEAARRTAEELRETGPEVICFSQFGPHRDPAVVFEQAERQLEFYRQKIQSRLAQGLSAEAVIDEILRSPPPGFGAYEGLSWSMARSIVIGFEIYLRRKGVIG